MDELARVERSDDELGRWRLHQRPAHPALAGSGGLLRGYEQLEPTPGRHVTTATALLPLVVSLDRPQRVVGSDGGVVEATAFLAGSHDVVGAVSAPAFTGIQLDLTPLAAHRMLGGGVDRLVRHTVPLDELFGPAARRLLERLQEAGGWTTRLSALEGFLLARLQAGPRPDDEVAELWRRLAGGATSIDAAVAGLGWSHRQVRRRVVAQLGLPPKRLARLLRFERTLRRLEVDRVTPLARLAPELGYYDQAHMANDVRVLSGQTPARLRARRAPA